MNRETPPKISSPPPPKWRLRRMGVHLILAIILGALLLSLIDRPSPRYSIVAIEPFPGGGRVTPTDINNRGQVVGYAMVEERNNARFAFHWDPIEGIRNLGVPVDYQTPHCQINDRGEVAIPSVIRDSTDEDRFKPVGYIWNASHRLEPLGNRSRFSSLALNNLGQLATARARSGSVELVVLGPEENISVVEEADQGVRFNPLMLSNSGKLLYRRFDSKNLLRNTFLWESSERRDPLLLEMENEGGFAGVDMNESGQVLEGSIQQLPTFAKVQTARLRTKDGVIDIGTLGGSLNRPIDLNNRGQVVGQSETSGEYWMKWLERKLSISMNVYSSWTRFKAKHLRTYLSETSWGPPFLWEGGTMWNLNDLIPSNSGWHLFRANAINDRGQIVGEGVAEDADGKLEGKAFLMTPLPGK